MTRDFGKINHIRMPAILPRVKKPATMAADIRKLKFRFADVEVPLSVTGIGPRFAEADDKGKREGK